MEPVVHFFLSMQKYEICRKIMYDNVNNSLISFSDPYVTFFNLLTSHEFCAHLQAGKVYCVNENYNANLYFAFFFQIFNLYICHSYITHMGIFVRVFSAAT